MIPPNSLFSVFAFTGFLLAAIPLPWHLQSWNTGTCMFMLWTSLGCLNVFINSIVWNDNVTNWAPVWCDISSRYMIGASIGIPASSLCIIHRLYHMTKLQTIFTDKKEIRRQVLVDLLLGVGFPCIVMALVYIVQRERFMIIEQIGCYPALVNTPALYALLYMWSVLIGLVSLVYAVLTFRRAFLQKEQLKKMLTAGFSISAGRYWRLMALCGTEIACSVPLSLFVMIYNAVHVPMEKDISWAWIHSDPSQIIQIPAAEWRGVLSEAVAFEITRSIYPLCACIIFAFFGWSQEVRDLYHQVFWSICRRPGSPKSPGPILPTTVTKQQSTLKTRSEYFFISFLSLSKNDDSARTSLALSFEAAPRPETPLEKLTA